MKKIAVILSGLVLLAACGFEPLYVQKKHNNSWYFGGKFDTSIADEMAKIKIEPIASRFGQQVRNQLIDLLSPRGQPKNPKYRLSAALVSKSVTQQAMRKDITATSERVIYKVKYQLFEGTKAVINSNSVAYVSYDILANPYSTIMAQKKTESDAAKIVADDMALRIGAYFHTRFTSSEKDTRNDI